MGYSDLVTYKRISPNKTSNHVIDTITIHCMAGNLTVETCGNIFSNVNRKASSNYGIGSDGRVAVYVDENDRSWCSSNRENDNRAVTIEVANDGGADTGWHISDTALNTLIKLCADICKRNNIKELKWLADKSLIGQVDKQNMTVHRWFANKACPGDYLYNLHGYIADEVNKLLGNEINTPVILVDKDENKKQSTFTCRVDISDLNIRVGAGTNYAKTGKYTGKGVFTITEVKQGQGSKTGWGKLKSGAGWISLDYATKI